MRAAYVSVFVATVLGAVKEHTQTQLSPDFFCSQQLVILIVPLISYVKHEKDTSFLVESSAEATSNSESARCICRADANRDHQNKTDKCFP